MKQLALPFALTQSYAAEDFCAVPSNAMAREWLARPECWSNSRLVLWGQPGCGKTHLLHIWAAEHDARITDALSLTGFSQPDRPIAIDDIDFMAEPSALLHLLNSAAEAGFPVLMTARLPPSRQTISLADLASRLRAAEAVEIRAPEDELLELLLARFAAERQLNISPATSNFLLTQLPRTADCLREAVARLDRAVASGARVTRQLLVEILADLADR